MAIPFEKTLVPMLLRGNAPHGPRCLCLELGHHASREFGQIRGAKPEDGVRGSRRRPYDLVPKQVRVDEGADAFRMSDGRHASDGIPGATPHVGGIRLPDGLARERGEFLRIDPVRPAGDRQHRIARDLPPEDERLRDLRRRAPDGAGRLAGRPCGSGQFHHLEGKALRFEPLLHVPCAGSQFVLHDGMRMKATKRADPGSACLSGSEFLKHVLQRPELSRKISPVIISQTLILNPDIKITKTRFFRNRDKIAEKIIYTIFSVVPGKSPSPQGPGQDVQEASLEMTSCESF